MAHIIQLGLGVLMNNLGVIDCTKFWEADERDKQIGENNSIDIGKSQKLWMEGNARINEVLAMRPDLAKIIEKKRMSGSSAYPQTNFHIAVTTSCLDYADTWSSKLVHWLSNSHSPNPSTVQYTCEERVEFDDGFTWVSLPITRIHIQLAQACNIGWIPTTLHNTREMDHRVVRTGSIMAIPVLDSVAVAKAYGYSPSY